MNNSDREKFKLNINGLGELYGKEISKPLLTIYYNVLKEFTLDQVIDAINVHVTDIKNGQFFPKPADIIRHLNAGKPSVEAKAEMAWAEINQKISSIGSYGNLTMNDNQALATVKALGGWKNICSKTIEQLVWLKKEFISIYENYEATSIESLPNELPGRIELETHKKSTSGFFKQLEQKKSELGVK